VTDAVAIIPARGGSKRIPGKNLRPFRGRPIIAYPIAAARDSGLFTRIVVSTDSEEIAAVARAEGAEIPFVRPGALADDHATTSAVLRHALSSLDANGQTFACCLYPTAVFAGPAELAAGLDLLRRSGARTVMTVAAFASPIQRALRRAPDGRVEMIWPETRDTRTNDLEEAFHDAGQFYWVRAADFLERPVLLGDDVWGLRLDRRRVCDIDTEEDWLWAEAVHEMLCRSPDGRQTAATRP